MGSLLRTLWRRTALCSIALLAAATTLAPLASAAPGDYV